MRDVGLQFPDKMLKFWCLNCFRAILSKIQLWSPEHPRFSKVCIEFQPDRKLVHWVECHEVNLSCISPENEAYDFRCRRVQSTGRICSIYENTNIPRYAVARLS